MFKPMLAEAAEERALRFPLYASPKLDGVRGVVIDGAMRSRSLKRFPNAIADRLFSRPELDGLDGELIVGDPTAKDAFRKTSGALGRLVGDPKAVFFVFDRTGAGTYEARYQAAAAQVASLPPEFRGLVVMLPHVACASLQQLQAVEEIVLDQGYEGLILRSPDGPYKHGRSTAAEGWMLKLKRFVDAEAEFLGLVEQMHNGNVAMRNEVGRSQRSASLEGLVPAGTMGAVVLRDLETGVVFTATGGTMKERDAWWATRSGECVPLRDLVADAPTWQLMHKSRKRCIVKYKHFPKGAKDKPRFPIIIGERMTIDMEAA